MQAASTVSISDSFFGRLHGDGTRLRQLLGESLSGQGDHARFCRCVFPLECLNA